MKLSKLILSCGLLLVFAAGVTQISAQAKKSPQTVLDYYLLMTTDQLSTLDSVKNRRSIIKKQDVANGYLRLESSDWEGWAEVALFRKTNREAVIGVVYVGCGPECSGAAQFFSYKNGKWADVTADVMPETLGDENILAAYNRIKTKTDEAYSLEDLPNSYWEMPQKGTTLKLALGSESDSKGKTLLKFNWNGTRFVQAR